MDLQEQMKEYSALKALQIILALAEQKGWVNISYIAEATGLSPSTVHRILQELQACGFVSKNKEARQYKLGMGMMNIALKVNMSDYLLEAAQEEMIRLNELSLETIHLIAPDNDKAVYIGKMDAKNQIQLRSRIGWKIPLQCTSGGKLILAYHSREWVDSYLNYNPLKQYTNNTIIHKETLHRELELIRQQGYSLDNREHNPDIVCIAAPIFGIDGNLAGTIGISAPDYRFSPEKACSFAEEVKRSAAAITEKLQA